LENVQCLAVISGSVFDVKQQLPPMLKMKLPKAGFLLMKSFVHTTFSIRLILVKTLLLCLWTARWYCLIEAVNFELLFPYSAY
jgi:hypothetical protein